MIFTKNKEGVRTIRAMKYKKCVAGKYTRARAPLARKYTNRIFEDGPTSMKIVNYIERHNFCWNDLLTKSNRSEIQTYKVEERTFGTPRSRVSIELQRQAGAHHRLLRRGILDTARSMSSRGQSVRPTLLKIHDHNVEGSYSFSVPTVRYLKL